MQESEVSPGYKVMLSQARFTTMGKSGYVFIGATLLCLTNDKARQSAKTQTNVLDQVALNIRKQLLRA